MTVIAINRYSDGVLASADAVSLSVTNAAGSVVLAPTAVAASTAGVYSYATVALGAGVYTATWVFTVSGQLDETVVRVFQVEAPVSVTQGITLAEIERRVAARIGPYQRYKAAPGSTINSVLVARLKTTLDIGDYEDLFLLRRGRYDTGGLVASFLETDRQRLVATYSSEVGALTPDQAWAIEPVEGEGIELHYLNPEQELRPSVVLGLERCYFEDTLEIAATSYIREVNLTASAFWITRPSQVRGVAYGRSMYNPTRAPWFECFNRGSDVWLRTAIPNVGTVRVTALRPCSTYVNGEDSFAGPDNDDDILSVAPLYAVRAGHISAWELATAKLADVAVQGRALQMKQVADAFTQASLTYAKISPEIIQNRFGQDDIYDSLQIGNA